MANLRVDKITSTETFEKTGSVQFDGTTDFLSLSSNTDFAMGTGDFTVECWVYVVSDTHVEGGYGQRVFDSNTGQLGIYINSDGTGGYVGALVSGTDIRPTVSHGIAPEGTWTHAAICRSGDDFRIFVNGREAAYRSGTGSVASSADFRIGARASGEGGFKGHISNFRVIKGTALYTSNFKPSMKELEVVPGTVLLACQSKTKTDLEKTGKAIEVQGNAVASELTPGILTPIVKSGGGSAITGSVEFDGSGDYLTIPNTEDLRLADSDFTIELWATISKVDSTYSPFALFENSTALRSYQLEVRSNGAVRFEWWYNGSSANDITTGTGAVIVNEWYHYAVSRNGATLKLFINGIEVGSSDVGTNSFFNNTVTPFIIGGMFQSDVQQQKWQGNISNLRIVKGTALYTDDFIPPTRELKKVPGTVLLCCQDPDSPLTEVTGKTITGYGDLRRTDGSELVTNGDFSNGTTGWTISDAGEGSMAVVSGQLVVTNDDTNDPPVYAWQQITTVAGNRYRVKFQLVGGTASSTAIYLNSASSFGNAYGQRATSGDNPLAVGALGELEFVAAGTSAYILLRVNANAAATSIFDNISAYAIPHDADASASNFTPQVGDDRQITFEGVTKINTENYFYFPTGDTITRESRYGRGIFMGGYTTSPSSAAVVDIHYINIPSMGNSRDFGDLVNAARWAGGSCGSSTRGLYGGGATPASTDHIDFVTIATTSNALDFGNLATAQGYVKACSNQTRGIWGGGRSNNSPVVSSDVIQYITIASTGNAIDFGNLTSARTATGNTASPVRALFGGGYTSPSTTAVDVIDYVTIASTGDATDFGDLLVDVKYSDVASSGIRGLWGGGSAPTTDTIQYVTISSTGNALDFGDLTASIEHISCTDNSIRGVFGGGVTPTYLNVLQYVTIATTGDAKDFGDLSRDNLGYAGGTSDSHGGLG